MTTKRVTQRRGGAGRYNSIDINVGGVRVAHAHESNAGPGWAACSDEQGIAWFNSWHAGLTYASVAEAAAAAKAYVRKALVEGNGK